MTFEEVKAKFLGMTSPPEVLDVEKGSAKRYAVAVDDLNPLYLDEEYARSTKYGVTLAPPGFFGWPVKQPGPMLPQLVKDVMDALHEAGFPDILDGGSDFEFLIPVRAGDTLVATRKVADMSSRGGSGGRQMAFSVIESTFTNQNGQLAVRLRQTLIALTPAPKS
ncbi:MAG: MaoC family dehydratase N-terminal domain-containing protein [Chloroflexota bacterium]